MADDRIARPKRLKHSETMERLKRLRKDYAVRPVGFDNERWASQRISRTQKHTDKAERQNLIHEADSSVKGLDFPAKEMAQIIRSWMMQDEED